MKISDLKNLFSGQITFASFQDLLKVRLSSYEKSHDIKGSTIPIEVIEDDVLFFGVEEFKFLLQAYRDEKLTKVEVAYIADAISLSSKVKFESDGIQDELEILCDFKFLECLSSGDIERIIENAPNLK